MRTFTWGTDGVFTCLHQQNEKTIVSCCADNTVYTFCGTMTSAYNTIVPPALAATLALRRPADHRSCGCRDACGSSFATAHPLHSIPKCSRSRENAARTYNTRKNVDIQTRRMMQGPQLIDFCRSGSRNPVFKTKQNGIVTKHNPNEQQLISCWVRNCSFKSHHPKLRTIADITF